MTRFFKRANDLEGEFRGNRPEQRVTFPIAANGSHPSPQDDEELLPNVDLLERTPTLELERTVAELTAELEQYRARDELIRETLVTAQEAASEILDAARRSASATLRKARSQADRIMKEAERRRPPLEAETRGVERLAAGRRAEAARLLKLLLDQLASAVEIASSSGEGERGLRPLPEPQGKHFSPGDSVRLTAPVLGLLEGPSRQLREVSTSEIGEVVDRDIATGLVEVAFDNHPGADDRDVIRLVVESARLEAAEQPAAGDTSVAS